MPWCKRMGISKTEEGKEKNRVREMSILNEEILWEREEILCGNGDKVWLCGESLISWEISNGF